MANWNWQELATEFRLQKIKISKNQRAKFKLYDFQFDIREESCRPESIGLLARLK